MNGTLSGVKVLDFTEYIAGPYCGQMLADMGADVTKVEPLIGDYWRLSTQVAPNESRGFIALNKGKKSIAIDLARPEGRELAQRLAAAPGPEGGLFVTNFPPDGFLSHARLAALRSDIITLRIMGWRDGSPAVDYTVNAAVGIPLMTGPPSLGEAPVNSVLPTWAPFHHMNQK